MNCSYHIGCDLNELTCRNGQCIPLNQKCDGTQNCRDGSDELECGMLTQQLDTYLIFWGIILGTLLDVIVYWTHRLEKQLSHCLFC